jgi:tellurite resistance protein TerC
MAADCFTPLVLVLIVVETTDLVFAVDSIPAVIAVTKEPFIIFTSNIMAILGLRALYFLLAAAMTQFHYLKPALAFILTFIGFKMVIEKLFHDPIHSFLHDVMKVGDPEYFLVVASLVIVLAVLAFGVIASIVYNRRHPGEHTHIKAAKHDLAPSSAD